MNTTTLLVPQILDLIKDTNLGNFTNNVLLAFGGIASVSIVYFGLMVYYQYQLNIRLKEQKSDLDMLIILVNEEYKKVNKIYNLLINENEKNIKKNNNDINNNNNDNSHNN